jgi:hypothetical protein
MGDLDEVAEEGVDLVRDRVQRPLRCGGAAAAAAALSAAAQRKPLVSQV